MRTTRWSSLSNLTTATNKTELRSVLIRNEDHFTGRDFEAPISSLEENGIAAMMSAMGIPGSTQPPVHITRDTIEAIARRIVDNSPTAADIASITTCARNELLLEGHSSRCSSEAFIANRCLGCSSANLRGRRSIDTTTSVERPEDMSAGTSGA